MKILLTNDFWAEIDGERLFDIFKRNIFENSKERMGWTEEDDVPDEYVWEDIDRAFDIAWKTFIDSLKTVEKDEYLVMSSIMIAYPTTSTTLHRTPVVITWSFGGRTSTS